MTCMALVVLAVMLPMPTELPTIPTTTVSGKTSTGGGGGRPTAGVKVQAYRSGGPFGDSTLSGKDGRYSLKVEGAKKFSVVYFHPDENYLPACKPDSGAFDDSNDAIEGVDVQFFTREEYVKKFGKDGLIQHLKRLISVMSNDDRVKEIKKLLEREP